MATATDLGGSRAADGASTGRVVRPAMVAYLAQQRPATADLPGLRRARPQARDVAHVPPNVLIVGTPEGCAWKSRRSIDGAREGGHDAQRVHAGDRRFLARGGRQSRSELFTIVHNPEMGAEPTH